jgi:hypothetical protein
VSTITKNVVHASPLKRHIEGPNGKPLCGGGNGGRKAGWQIDFGNDPNCEVCLTLAIKRSRILPSPATAGAPTPPQFPRTKSNRPRPLRSGPSPITAGN